MSHPTDRSTRIRLRLLDEEHTFAVPVPPVSMSLVDVLPASRRLSDQATEVVLDHFRQSGSPVSCKSGCGACCRQLVAVSLPEAADLDDLVKSLPPRRQAVIRERFRDGLRRLEEAGLLEADAAPDDRALLAEEQPTPEETMYQLSRSYFHLGIACPFLDDESCSIYERRPAVCREYHVLTPAEHCSAPDQRDVERMGPTPGITNALARTAHRLLGERPRTIPLLLALEWAERHAAPLRQALSGERLLLTLADELEEES